VPAPSSILADRVTFRLRSIDRLYLNLYQPLLQTPGLIRAFLCHVRGAPIPSPALFGQMGRDFTERVERFAAEEGIEIVAFPRGADKEDIADRYFARAPEREGVLFIGVAQERSSSWWGTVRHGASDFDCAFARRTVFVRHYYFYLRDREWGRAFLKFCSYAPFAGRAYLNGHSWLQRQLARRGIGYSELDNGLLACADPDAAQRLAGALGAPDIEAFLRRWLPRLPLPLTAADQAAGYRYRPSLWQAELSDTLVFARPRDGRLWFEHTLRAQLDLGRPSRVQLVFGRRISRRTPGLFRTRVITDGVDPSIEQAYRRSKVKAYFKLGRALRVETTVNDAHDLGLGRSLCNMAELLAKMRAINARMLAALDERAVPLAPAAALERVVLPTRTAAGQRAPALRFGDPRVMAIWSALCCVALLPCGFDNAVLRALIAPLLGAPLADYSARRMSYDLRRLVRKQVIARVAGTHRYVLTADGRRLALTFAGTYRRILLPALGELAATEPRDAPRPLALAWHRLARELDRFIDDAAA
jgi:hypothetical protein